MQPVITNNKVYEYQQQDQRSAQVKSPSVLTFGGSTITSNQTSTANLNQHPFIPSTTNVDIKKQVLQEQTLNKQGQIPVPKDQKPVNQVSKINPKDLSNEELEYIIKTGKLPQRLAQDNHQQPQLQQQQPLLQSQNQHQQQQAFQQQQQFQQIQNQQLQKFSTGLSQQSLNQSQFNQQQQQPTQMLQKTATQLNQLHNFLGGGSQLPYNKENFYIPAVQHNNEMPSIDLDQKELKNYNSPRMIPDGYQISQNSISQGFQNHQSHLPVLPNLLTAQIQPIQHLGQSQVQNYQQLQGSFYNGLTMDASQQLNTKLDISQSKDQNSQAASQAMKALSDKIKQLEQQNQLLEDKLQLVSSQQQDSSHRLSSKLKEETERSSTREIQLSEEIAILKKRLENAEADKMRHLEENCTERERWRGEVKRVEDENVMLRKQLQEQIQKYDVIEVTIQELKKREEILRDRYEMELHSERDKSKAMMEEMEENRSRYEQLKQKISQKAKDLSDERDQLSEKIDQMLQDHQREASKIKSESSKWKRECQMLKEELSILNSKEPVKPVKREPSQTNPATQRNSGISSLTPKGSLQNSSGRLCYSPGSQKTQELKQKQNQTADSQIHHFKSIESQENYQPIKKKSGTKKSSKKSEKRQQSSSALYHQKSRDQDDSKKVIPQEPQITTQSAHHSRPLTQSDRKSRQNSASASKRPTKSRKNSKSQQRRQSSSKKKPASDQITGRQLSGTLSQSNLISINTKFNRAEHISVDDVTLFSNSLSNEQRLADAILMDSKFGGIQSVNSRLQEVNGDRQTNQYKRTSAENTLQFGQTSTNSDYSAAMFNSQNANQLGESIKQSKPLELAEFSKPAESLQKQVENEIFYLERDIFDYNQQYKFLLSQQNGSPTYSVNSDTGNINTKLRQIAQQLEEKSERLFELKKQQQNILMQQTFKEKNPFSESQSLTSTGVKAYQVRQNY